MWVDPEQRVVVRPPPRPRTLAGTYLAQAVSALRDSGSSDALYDDAFREAAAELRSKAWVLVAMSNALETRAGHSRSAILFAAFAAEAYVNEFVTKHFSGRDYETIDRLPPVEKYALAPRLALGREVFSRSQEPLQTLRELFRERDVLVHPKPEKGVTDRPAWPHRGEPPADPVYNPTNACRFIVAVADSAKTLVEEGGLGEGFDMHAHLVLTARDKLENFAAEVTERMTRPADEPRPANLLSWAMPVE